MFSFFKVQEFAAGYADNILFKVLLPLLLNERNSWARQKFWRSERFENSFMYAANQAMGRVTTSRSTLEVTNSHFQGAMSKSNSFGITVAVNEDFQTEAFVNRIDRAW